MAPSGLPDDPVVIDDRMDTRESFIDMRKKLVALQKEIQEVIDRQEEEMRRQEEKELNDFCRSHHILIVDKEDEQDEEHVTKNPLKRSRSASSPPPLIPIHDAGLDDNNEDAMNFLQVSMANDSKRVKRTRRWQQHREWTDMHVGAKIEPVVEEEQEVVSEDEVEIVDEIIGGQQQEGDEAVGGGCINRPGQDVVNLGGNMFTKVEIVWPQEQGCIAQAQEIADHNINMDKDGREIEGKHLRGQLTYEGITPDPPGAVFVNEGQGNEPVDYSSDADIEIINEIINKAEREDAPEGIGIDLKTKQKEEAVLLKEKMRSFQEKKKQYWAIQDKANDIIDSTRARANFDQQANKELVAADDDSGCDGIEPDDGEGSTNEEEEDLVFEEENLEYKNNDCEATDEDQMEKNDDERSGGIETPVIPVELLNEVDTLNNMKDQQVEKWKSPKEMMLAGCNEASKNEAIWRKIGAIFIVNKFFEFLAERGYQMSVTKNMVAAC